MLRSYKFGSRRFDTFAVTDFLRLARSCRVVEKFDQNHRFFMIFCRSGPEKRSIGSDFSAMRYDLDKRRKKPSANVLNFMLASLQHLGASERRVLPVQRSDFAEKQHAMPSPLHTALIREATPQVLFCETTAQTGLHMSTLSTRSR